MTPWNICLEMNCLEINILNIGTSIKWKSISIWLLYYSDINCVANHQSRISFSLNRIFLQIRIHEIGELIYSTVLYCTSVQCQTWGLQYSIPLLSSCLALYRKYWTICTYMIILLLNLFCRNLFCFCTLKTIILKFK